MAELTRCTDRFAHIELRVPRALWTEFESIHETRGQALGDCRRRFLASLEAALVSRYEAALEAQRDSEGEARPFR